MSVTYCHVEDEHNFLFNLKKPQVTLGASHASVAELEVILEAQEVRKPVGPSFEKTTTPATTAINKIAKKRRFLFEENPFEGIVHYYMF